MANPNLAANALLKPSQKSPGKSLTRQRNVSRYEILKDKIRTWWNDRLMIGEALREIRDGRLYKDEYPNFEDFCVDEFGLKHTQAYRLIDAANLVKSVKTLSPIGERIVNEGQARALATVPETERVEVLMETVKTGKVTAKRITEVAATVVKKIIGKKAAPEVKDEIGRIVPEELIGEWERSVELSKELKRHAQAIVEIMRNGIEKNDPLFREYSNSIISQAEGLRYSVTAQLRAYAVCHNCQGRLPSRCQTCHGRGFYSKYYFDSPSVPEKIKKMLGIT